MSYRTGRQRQSRWRLIFLLLLMSVIAIGGLAWQRDWRTPQQVMQGMYQAVQAQSPEVLGEMLPVMPAASANPPRLSDRVALVDTEVLPNPQSQAYTADLYLQTNLDGVVPWPNAGGRTEVISHTVTAGNTLYGIGFQYDLDLNTLLWANPSLNPENPLLQIGQQLRILPVQGVYHIVDEGETVELIAAFYGVPPTHISNYPPNNLYPPFELQAGQRLIVPYGRQRSANEPVPPLVVSSPMAWPLVGLISKGFHSEQHPGLKINAPEGSLVEAATQGTVESVSENQGGVIVVLTHGNDLESWYGHLLETSLEVGNSVALGETVGRVGGSESDEAGSYLYFAVYQAGEPVDPLTYLPGGSG